VPEPSPPYLTQACPKHLMLPAQDPAMAQRLMDANPNSFRKLVATFLEANGRGGWVGGWWLGQGQSRCAATGSRWT
jgi:hypothetical protein